MSISAYKQQDVARYVGVSTDTKPSIPATTPSLFLERDTGVEYVWDGTAWAMLGGGRVSFGAVTLLASAARTANGAGSDVTDVAIEAASALVLVCDVTAQSGTTPTLDVEVLAKIGSNYTPLARFSRYSAATGVKGVNVKRDLSFATELTLAADPAVGNGLLANNHDWLDTLKIKYAIAGTTPSFTFSVSAHPIR